MAADPQLVPRDALTGVRVALSVSPSDDLARLGLDPVHLDLAVAELSRATVIAGGTLVYGGGINYGFTQIVQEQADRYARGGCAFEHFVPYTEHATLDEQVLREYEASLGVHSTVRLIDAEGRSATVAESERSGFARADVDPCQALTVMRQLLGERCDARILIGGRLAGYQGAMPGVLEEAVLTLNQRRPIYAAGGFGGAAAFIGRCLEPERYSWLPVGMPSGASDGVPEHARDVLACPAPENGLTPHERAVLAATHRPSDVASLTVLGLSRLHSDEVRPHDHSG